MAVMAASRVEGIGLAVGQGGQQRQLGGGCSKWWGTSLGPKTIARKTEPPGPRGIGVRAHRATLSFSATTSTHASHSYCARAAA